MTVTQRDPNHEKNERFAFPVPENEIYNFRFSISNFQLLTIITSREFDRLFVNSTLENSDLLKKNVTRALRKARSGIKIIIVS